MDYKQIGENAQGSPAAPAAVPEAAAGGDAGAMGKAKHVLAKFGTTVKDSLPDVSGVYLDPISPTADITLSDRWHLIMQAAKPWGDFFALSQFNLPPWSQIKVRIGHNITTYFYNYFLLTVLHLIIFAVFHLTPVLTAIALSAALYALFVWQKDAIQITSDIEIDHTRKLIIAAVLIVLALLFGELLSLFFSVAFFVLIVVGIHATFRDDVSDDDALPPSAVV